MRPYKISFKTFFEKSFEKNYDFVDLSIESKDFKKRDRNLIIHAVF